MLWKTVQTIPVEVRMQSTLAGKEWDQEGTLVVQRNRITNSRRGFIEFPNATRQPVSSYYLMAFLGRYYKTEGDD
jgi:hypothetical protein